MLDQGGNYIIEKMGGGGAIQSPERTLKRDYSAAFAAARASS